MCPGPRFRQRAQEPSCACPRAVFCLNQSSLPPPRVRGIQSRLFLSPRLPIRRTCEQKKKLRQAYAQGTSGRACRHLLVDLDLGNVKKEGGPKCGCLLVCYPTICGVNQALLTQGTLDCQSLNQLVLSLRRGERTRAHVRCRNGAANCTCRRTTSVLSEFSPSSTPESLDHPFARIHLPSSAPAPRRHPHRHLSLSPLKSTCLCWRRRRKGGPGNVRTRPPTPTACRSSQDGLLTGSMNSVYGYLQLENCLTAPQHGRATVKVRFQVGRLPTKLAAAGMIAVPCSPAWLKLRLLYHVLRLWPLP